MNKTKAWIHAFRLRTLPLALSSIFLGSFLAAAHHSFSLKIFILATLTTLFLQILSNLANDLGDSISGADNNERVGPERAVQSGVISHKEMKGMLIVFVLLSLCSGLWLLYEGMQLINLKQGVIMLVIGLLAIGAAINYTVGKNPYGYSGFGDLFVFLFFGLVGVLGTYFLHTGNISWGLFLPAVSVGLLSVGVLNLNNMRDIDNDARTGKMTLVVKMGTANAKRYHFTLLSTAMILPCLYTIFNWQSAFQFLFLLSFPFIVRNVWHVFKNENARDLDPELKRLAISTLLFSLSFGFGLVL
ncbi:1,4-dihydroxy-2-naphthoate polyprenyltransferase [Labilibaculum sp. A4]|uniref:1,4-dihydroxy-2-naphthoate polyprenyltransferase n=1 Tax=Labilibaculum euxinus TaxID=2686357 RepID=UPI000F618E12|nr:1,4-dihydroxy-2-naphthoate polyprenyltransferase [Labilibaculum euxinus]MDQ1771815.1 1,4-dihydroxy-2-naphthoate polyprenyltransferase [Labilibaculum euxinus]MWN77718.1 1,4-dihydroxy-2-naphthoate polyprenyltransferase [Labilibaculum euxinus]